MNEINKLVARSPLLTAIVIWVALRFMRADDRRDVLAVIRSKARKSDYMRRLAAARKAAQQ